MSKRLALLAALLFATLHTAKADEPSCKFATVDGIRIFYREAGNPDAPTILLLHGFPSSSHMFRTLMPKLAGRFHLIAPDYPGMGFSDAPPAASFKPSFDSVAEITEKLVAQLGVNRMIVYEQDFGGPVGMRLAVRHPDWIAGLIIQNTPITLDGWDPARLKAIEANADLPMADKRAAAESRVVPTTAQFLYQHGARQPAALDPASWAVDAWVMRNPESRRIMTDLQLDIPSNFQQYPVWQAYLKRRQPKTLVVWGRQDPIFSPDGAEAVKRFVPAAEIRYYDTGHFALEEDSSDIARQISRVFAAPAQGRTGSIKTDSSERKRAHGHTVKARA